MIPQAHRVPAAVVSVGSRDRAWADRPLFLRGVSSTRLALRASALAACAVLGAAGSATGDDLRRVAIVTSATPASVVGTVGAAIADQLGPAVEVRVLSLAGDDATAPGAYLDAFDPDVVVPLGPDALEWVRREEPDRSRVFALTDGGCGEARGARETGVRLRMTAPALLAVLRDLKPDATVLGVAASESPSARCSAQALEEAAGEVGFSVRLETVTTSREQVHAFRRMARGVDAFVLLPDPTVTTAESHAYSVLLGLETRKPVLGYGTSAVEHGALFGEWVDPTALGRQTALLVQRVLAGESPGSIPPAQPAPTRLAFNRNTARVVGVRFPERLLRDAEVYGAP